MSRKLSKKEGTTLQKEIEELIRRNKLEDAYEILKGNLDDLFEFDAPYAVETCLALSLDLHEFDRAYEDLERLEGKPYVNQQTEEALRDAKGKIRQAEKAYYAPKKKNKIPAYTPSMNEKEAIAIAFDEKTPKSKEGIAFLLAMATDPARPDRPRTLALMGLMRGGYSESIDFRKNGTTYHLIPSKTPAPLQEAIAEKVYTRLLKSKDTGKAQLSTDLLGHLAIGLFPKSLSSFSDEEGLYKTLTLLASSCFGEAVEFASGEEEDLFKRAYELIFDSCYSRKGKLPES